MSEQAKTLVPKLRFPEFQSHKSWDSKKLEDLIDTVSPPQKLQTSQYQTAGKYPIFDQSQTYICGWTDNTDALVKDNLPHIIFGDHTCALKIANEPFAQGADGIKILQTKNEVETQFLYQSLQNKPLVMEEYKRHFSTLKERIVCYPDIDTGEQQKIADCLSSLDDLIAAQNQKIEALKQHKKGLMQQLFPAEGETVPKLRFPEFSQLWTKTPLGMLCSSISSGRDQLDIDGRYELYGSTSIIGKTINPSFQGERILVARVGANAGFLTKANGIFGVTDNTLVISLNSSINIDYVYYYLGNVNINKLIFGSGQPLITGSILKALDIPVPIDSEQKKISDCLLSLDGIIAGQNSKLESLMTLKKGLMQQLFPVLERVEV